MDKAEETIYRSIEKAYGKSILAMKEQQFTEIMTAQPIGHCNAILAALRAEKTFYQKVLDEEYRKKNPASKRYAEAAKFLPDINAKGKLLKSIIETKSKS